jgi:hypothetical protein
VTCDCGFVSSKHKHYGLYWQFHNIQYRHHGISHLRTNGFFREDVGQCFSALASWQVSHHMTQEGLQSIYCTRTSPFHVCLIFPLIYFTNFLFLGSQFILFCEGGNASWCHCCAFWFLIKNLSIFNYTNIKIKIQNKLISILNYSDDICTKTTITKSNHTTNAATHQSVMNCTNANEKKNILGRTNLPTFPM